METNVSHSLVLPTIAQIALESMQTAGCDRAAVFRWDDGAFVLVADVGDGPFPEVDFADEGSGRGDTARHISMMAGTALAPEFASLQPRFANAPAPGCSFAIPISGGRHRGLLIVINAASGPFHNMAQRYVLRGHAAHIATLFEVEALQTAASASGQDHHYLEASQRLRLLESVTINALDSILITEAEPISLPGPRIIYCNAAFTKTTGYTSDDVIGKTPRILQGPDTDPLVRARLRAAFEAWQPIEVELLNYRKDGSTFWAELSIVPVADERGWYTHWVSVQRDVTNRKITEELATRVRVAEVENKALESELRERVRVEADLSFRAFHDSLTKLNNRAFFMNRLNGAFDRAVAGRSGPFSILYIDLDQFKVVNDSLGHTAGDAMLVEVANRLRQCVRPQDTLSRIGGDEFALLIDGTDDIAIPVTIAERIREILLAPIQLGRQAIFPSCSMGIALSRGRLENPEALIRDADIAMYQAKREGRGGYAIFNPAMHAEAVMMLALRTDLRFAIERGEFRIVYQPIVRPADGRVVAFEALVRWHHPDRGLVTPAQFIPIAEKMGLIRQIDRWVMREACAQLRRWHAQPGQAELRISVNTSVAGFTDPDFFDELSDMLAIFELEPRMIELEITESIFLHPSPTVIDLIRRFRARGVRIALDDFGTGYSSLSYITQYQIDSIKIDRSFISDICTEPRTRAVLELIARLGITLDIQTIAEGIETAPQAELAAAMGCTYLQGFHFAEPLAASEASALLRANHPAR